VEEVLLTRENPVMVEVFNLYRRCTSPSRKLF